ncbi:MAG: protein kinase, partial [Verrucomicrobiota bacterium]
MLAELEASSDRIAARPWPPSPDDARNILCGQPYEVLDRIGHGGMGAVFKVRNLEPGMRRLEAVKIRRPEVQDDDLFHERFLREINTLAQLRHPGITTVYRSGDSAEGYLWFSMEFLEGRSLAELLAPGLPPLSPERVLEITRQLCVTLQF